MISLRVVGVTLRALPALIWAIAAYSAWRSLLLRRRASHFDLLFALLATVVAADFSLSCLFWVLPRDLASPPDIEIYRLYLATDLLTILALALLRHMLRYVPAHEAPPGGSWLVVNYGMAFGLAGFAAYSAIPFEDFALRLPLYRTVFLAYEISILLLGLVEVLRLSRRGLWRAGGGLTVLRHADVALVAAGSVGIAGILWIVVSGRNSPPVVWLSFDVLIGLALSMPIAVRFLGEVVRAVAVLSVVLVAVVGARGLLALATPPAHGPEEALATVGTVVLVLVFWLAQPWLRAAIERLVFRRSRRRRAELQAYFLTLSPELGSEECCRRALAELVRMMQLDGAAILLRGGEVSVQGHLRLEALREAWSAAEAAGALPAHTVGKYALSDMPVRLREALSDVDVTAITPVISPRHRWGHLLLSAGLLGSYFTEEDALTVQSFADQLALLLDSAELLERALAVERSLAHSEKLAAIGELAARVAHEIRNPVTAARSLAQLLLRNPASPGDAEAAELILAELGRVERQVAALLRYARKDDLHLEGVDLGELARETVDRFRARLEAGCVEVHVDAPAGIVVSADREKILQVLVNLVENTLDALAETEGERRLQFELKAIDGHAFLRISDSGPGAPPEALPRLFEPFFSLKSHGTGLGLAIVKRTVEAHGGRIVAEPVPRSGLAIQIDLPLATGGRADP